MPDLPPLRKYFHDVRNRLNVLSAMAFVTAATIEESSSDSVGNGEESLQNIDTEYVIFEKNFEELLKSIAHDVGTSEVLTPSLEKLSTSMKQLKALYTQAKNIYATKQTHKISLNLVPLLNQFYDQIHFFAACLDELKLTIKAIGKYPS